MTDPKDPDNPADGILYGCALSALFWMLFWMLYWTGCHD